MGNELSLRRLGNNVDMRAWEMKGGELVEYEQTYDELDVTDFVR